MFDTAADFLPLSALQHLLYCERQCALIHLEQQWAENRYTAEGTLLHERVDEGTPEARPDRRIVRSLPLRSERLRLVGKADTVELTRDRQGVAVLDLPGRWSLFPVEHKRGRPKRGNRCDEVQLCAQALCLEEMLGSVVRLER